MDRPAGGLFEGLAIFDLEEFRQHASQILDLQPVATFLYYGQVTQQVLDQLIAVPALSRAGALRLGGFYPGSMVARALHKASHLSSLRYLQIDLCELGNDGARILARSKCLKSLTELSLFQSGIGVDGLKALTRGRRLETLERLTLGWNLFPASAVKVLAKASLPRLRALHLGMHPIGDVGLGAILKSDWVEGLEYLDLKDCALTSKSIAMLGTCGRLNRLETLNLHANRMGAEGAAGLAAGQFPALRFLDLEFTDLDGRGMKSLTRSPWIGHVEHLKLSGNTLGALGATSLAQADLTELKTLSFSAAKISPLAFSAFADRGLPNLRWMFVSTSLKDAKRPCYLTNQAARYLCDPGRFPALTALNLGKVKLSPKVRELLTGRFGSQLRFTS